MGQAVARDLIRKGWTIAVIDLDRKAGYLAAEEYGGIFVPTNVTNWESILNAFERVWETYGRIDFGNILLSPCLENNKLNRDLFISICKCWPGWIGTFL